MAGCDGEAEAFVIGDVGRVRGLQVAGCIVVAGTLGTMGDRLAADATTGVGAQNLQVPGVLVRVGFLKSCPQTHECGAALPAANMTRSKAGVMRVLRPTESWNVPGGIHRATPTRPAASRATRPWPSVRRREPKPSGTA